MTWSFIAFVGTCCLAIGVALGGFLAEESIPVFRLAPMCRQLDVCRAKCGNEPASAHEKTCTCQVAP